MKKLISRANLVRNKNNYYVGLPPKGSVFRIHPVNELEDVSVLYHESTHKWYVLDAQLMDEIENQLGSYIPGIYSASLYQSTDYQGVNNIVLVNRSESSEPILTAIALAKQAWIKRNVTKKLGFDEVADFNKKPVWNDFDTLLNMRLQQGNQYLDDVHHPIINAFLAS